MGRNKDSSNRDKLLKFLQHYDSSLGVTDKQNICGLDAWSICTKLTRSELEDILDVKAYHAYSLNTNKRIFIIKHSDLLSLYNECNGSFNFSKRFNFSLAHKYGVVVDELNKIIPTANFNMDYCSGLLYCSFNSCDDVNILIDMLELKNEYFMCINSYTYVINTNMIFKGD